jgi:hypothetical protein
MTDEKDAPLNRHERRILAKLQREKAPVNTPGAPPGMTADRVFSLVTHNLTEEDVAMVGSEVSLIKDGVLGAGTDDRAVIVKEYTQEVRQTIKEILTGTLRTPAFRDMLVKLTREAAVEIAKEILAEEGAELESRVRAIVKERWDTEVTNAAHAFMQSKLDEVKRKL